MRRFQLSLRDVFLAIKAICVQLGLFALLIQLPRSGQTWLVTCLFGLAFLAVPIALAVAVSNPQRHASLLSWAIAFITVCALCHYSTTFDPLWQLVGEYEALGDARSLYGLSVWTWSFSTGLVCAWITRSLTRLSSN